MVVPDRVSAPAVISTTAYARNAPASRHAGSAAHTLTTCPSLATKATSIANFMKKVWIALVGAMMSAVVSGSERWRRSPTFLVLESTASCRQPATMVPVRALRR